MDQPGIMAPMDFPIRDPRDKSMFNGRNVNPPRFMEVGGLHTPSKWFKETGNPQASSAPVAEVKAPTGVSSGRRAAKRI